MDYVTGSPVGTTLQTCTPPVTSDPASIAAFDVCQWNNTLFGAAETTAGGTNIGAMIGARGCVTNSVATMPREFTVAVVWQGIAPTAAPTTTTCGQNAYGNEATRRAMVMHVMIACLQNDPTTGVCITP